MRRIVLSNGEEYATNVDDGGVFVRENWGFRQLMDKVYTPVFKHPGEFRAYLRNRFDIGEGRIVEEMGWNGSR